MNKLKIIFSVLLVSFFCVLFNTYLWSANNSNDDKYYWVINRFSKHVKSKYGYVLQAEGGSVYPDGSIKEITLAFAAPHFYGNDNAKRELIELCTELLEFFNSQPYVLENRGQKPISWENLHIAIFYKDENGNRLYDPNLWSISLHKEKIQLFIDDPNEEFKVEVVKEPLDEVIKKVKKG